MRIVCLVKQVPHPSAVEFDQETKQLKREGVPLLLNPFDAYAVQHAAGLRADGDEVVTLTMGPPQAEEALRETMRLGADRAVHLSDRVFAVADTIGTSRTIALALRKLGADVVVCGRKTVDAETAQVPPEVAAFLGRPHVTSVVTIERRGDSLRLTRETDAGTEVYEAEPPLLVSVVAAPSDPPAARGSEEGPIEVWTAADLVGEVRPYDKRFGQPGSPTRVLAVRDVRPPRSGLVTTDAAEAAQAIRERLGPAESAATSWEKPDRLGDKPGKSYDCWTAVELVDGRPTRLSLELLAKGRELAGKLGGRNVALVLGEDVAGIAQEAGRHGAEVVVEAASPDLREYHPERWSAALRHVLERERPHVLLIPASASGRDFGPRAAGELELGMTADCVGLGIDRAGRLIQNKPAYGGAIVSVIMGATTPQLATVRSRMFDPLEPRDDVAPEVRRLGLGPLPDSRVRLVERRDDSPALDLEEAETVVCVGRSVGDRDAVAEIERLAALLGAAVGGDREACEAGLLPRNRQIGLYGRALAPQLYVAVSVNGDFEHVAGPMKAGVIVALDADRDAPMLREADVALVGDWRETLPALVDGFETASA
ncbi:MAG TPA: FAD-binding protein [Gaiellaceae bacterium]|jgi:electron transfer flavoprotein alpha subunit|nr:FAD-binding protein [Gaiellaceae bacterium]